MKRNKTVDEYIAGSAQWETELTKIRGILTATDLKEESKWGAPCIKRYVNEAIELVKSRKSISPVRKTPIFIPPELKQALTKSKTTQKNFAALTPGKQREYAQYISSAKRTETKLLRVAKILPMINAGIGLNDKYRSPKKAT